jgi:cytochrome c oxidase subunit 4
MSTQHVFSLKTNYTVFGVLMGLLVLTYAAARAPFPEALHVPIAMTIAIVKTLVIMLYFMHLRYTNKLVWLGVGSSFLFLAVLFAITTAEYNGRGWLGNTEAVAGAESYFGIRQTTVDNSSPEYALQHSEAKPAAEASHE